MAVGVSEALAFDGMIVDKAWRTVDETVAALVHHLVVGGRLPPALEAAAVAGILSREALASTAMVDIGVSIPHARLEGVDGILGVLAVSRHAVYQVTDGLPISIVALVLSSQLREAQSPAELLAVVRRHEGARR